MTDTFWLLAVALLILALGFIAWPLFSRRSSGGRARDLRDQNLLAYRSRMTELDEEYKAGNLDDENYRQLRDELAGSMLDDVPEAQQPLPSRAAGAGRKGAVVVVLASLIVVPAVSLYLYQQWGALDRVEEFLAMQEIPATEGERAKRMDELTAQLRARLEANPDNAEGWTMLARTYMRLEQYQDAAWAFKRLADVAGGTPQNRATAWGMAAQASYFASEGEFTEEVKGAIDQARQLNPDEINSLGLLGIRAFGAERYEAAIGFWERITEVAPQHPQLESIREGIRTAYQRLGQEPPQTWAQAESTESAGSAGVTLEVELADAFAGEVPADAVVYVFAREANSQGGPPLAVARLSPSQLPTRLRLDDRNAMGAGSTLSDASQVRVTARISRSGTPASRPGDWEGTLPEPVAVSPDQESVGVLTIDSQIR